MHVELRDGAAPSTRPAAMVVCGVCTLVNTPGATECDACQTVLPACSGAANPRRKRALSPPPGRQIIELTSDDDDEPQLNESRSRATAAASSTNFEGASSSRGGGGGGGGSGARTRRRSRSPEVKVIDDESEKEALRLHWEEGRLKKDRLKAEEALQHDGTDGLAFQ